MAGVNEPSEKSAQVDLPHPTAGESSDSISREAVRIQLPAHEPADNRPISSTPLPASVDPPASGLKKEMPRVAAVPEPCPSTSETKNSQPRIETPAVAPQNSLPAVASEEKKPMLLWWILLGISALILIIQIWTYIS